MEDSPFVGFGFQADRILLGTHMHNAFMQSLIQTGVLGAIPFMAAVLLGWFLLVKLGFNLSRFPTLHRHLIIQCAALLGFFTIRGFPESTGAFFGIDWLVLAPLLMYLQVVGSTDFQSTAKPVSAQ